MHPLLCIMAQPGLEPVRSALMRHASPATKWSLYRIVRQSVDSKDDLFRMRDVSCTLAFREALEYASGTVARDMISCARKAIFPPFQFDEIDNFLRSALCGGIASYKTLAALWTRLTPWFVQHGIANDILMGVFFVDGNAHVQREARPGAMMAVVRFVYQHIYNSTDIREAMRKRPFSCNALVRFCLGAAGKDTRAVAAIQWLREKLASAHLIRWCPTLSALYTNTLDNQRLAAMLQIWQYADAHEREEIIRTHQGTAWTRLLRSFDMDGVDNTNDDELLLRALRHIVRVHGLPPSFNAWWGMLLEITDDPQGRTAPALSQFMRRVRAQMVVAADGADMAKDCRAFLDMLFLAAVQGNTAFVRYVREWYAPEVALYFDGTNGVAKFTADLDADRMRIFMSALLPPQ